MIDTTEGHRAIGSPRELCSLPRRVEHVERAADERSNGALRCAFDRVEPVVPWIERVSDDDVSTASASGTYL
jgi:hypothetical protein